jgi:uncharacterized protein with PQ loop repeat
MEGAMTSMPCDGRTVCPPKDAPPSTPLEKFLRALSVITMLMSIPQAVSVWTGEARGVSALTWGTYLVSALAWFVYGFRKRDKTIYVACIGWIVIDAAIVVGVLFR